MKMQSDYAVHTHCTPRSMWCIVTNDLSDFSVILQFRLRIMKLRMRVASNRPRFDSRRARIACELSETALQLVYPFAAFGRSCVLAKPGQTAAL